MITLKDLLRQKATLAIKKAFPNLTDEEASADVATCQEAAFGHYQCNSALRLGKLLKKNPKDVAQLILDNFDVLSEDGNIMIGSFEIAGPGFINFVVAQSFISSGLQNMLGDKYLGAVPALHKEKVVVDFSSPNIAKELHVGHLRSTIIGDSIARLLEFLDYNVLRLNHVGDWGTQFGMLITYMKRYQQKVISGEEKADLVSLTSWYKAAKKQFDTDEDFKKQAHLEVVNLQSGEKEAMKIWKVICDISRKAFEEIYSLLDVNIIERGESFYNPYFAQMIEDLEKRKIITISDGSKCIFLEGYLNREGNPLPVIIQKSDGGFNYDTTDLAGFWHRVHVEKADRIIIVTDAGQSLHFQMIFDAAVKAGYVDPSKVRFDHVPFGNVLGPDGKKFKTREGETEKLIDLLNVAIVEAEKVILERLPDISKEELKELSYALGIGSVKYADLSCHRVKDYTFSYDRMLKFEGNTAPFLLYSYVRVLGIKRKSSLDMQQVMQHAHIDLEHPSEILLGLHLRRFGETIEMFVKDLLPNRLSDYLYELAEKFNIFFRDCRVVGSEKEKERLLLCELTEKVLHQGLSILGLKTVTRM